MMYKLFLFFRKYIYCNHNFFYVHSTHCFKCGRKVRLTQEEYWEKQNKKLKRENKRFANYLKLKHKLNKSE